MDPARVRQVAGVIGAAVGLLGVVGFVVSFARVSAAAGPSFGRLAPAVPVGIDLDILVFSAAGIVLAWLDMPARWLRLVPAGLTAATIWLNIAGQPTTTTTQAAGTTPTGGHGHAFAVVAHAVLPGLWVLAVAMVEHVVRHRLALDTGTRMDTVRASRWLLAPVATGRLWRRMVLWEIRSYPAALARERDRLLALCDLQDTYGRIAWRWKAPRRARALYRLGELTPTPGTPGAAGGGSDPSLPAPGDASTTTPGGSTPAGAGTTPAGSRRGTGGRRAGRSKTTTASTGRRSMPELRAELHAAIQAGRLDARPSAEAIRKALACSPTRARALRDETTQGSVTTTPPAPVPSGGAGSDDLEGRAA